MAPHWKCGLGQPIAGSNPALSATPARRAGRPMRALPPPVLAHAPFGVRSLRSSDGAFASTAHRGGLTFAATELAETVSDPHLPSITPLLLSEFRFPDPELAERVGVVVGYAVRHEGGILLFDTGFRLRECGAGGCLPSGRAPDRRGPGGGRHRDRRHHRSRQLPPSRRPRRDRTPRFPGSRSTSSRSNGSWPTRPTTRSSSGSTSRALATSRSRATTSVAPGIRVVATPGHTPGHQSLVVDGPDGPIVLAGQACYTVGEWTGDPDALEGRSGARDQAAYDRSIERLRALRSGPGPLRPRPRTMDGMTDRSGVSFPGRARRGTSGAL